MHQSMLAVVLTVAAVSAAVPDSVEQPLAVLSDGGEIVKGTMNWSENVLSAHGQAVAPDNSTNAVQRRLLGFRAAKDVAYRNLLELAGQIQIDSQTLVEDVMAASDSIRTRVIGIVQGARVTPGSHEEVGRLYRIGLQVQLGTGFADAVLPEFPDARPADLVAGIGGPAAADSGAAGKEPAGADSTPPVFVPSVPYTGLIVDARSLGLQPSMAPRVITEDSSEVYSPAFVERTYATYVGMVGYEREMQRAVTSDRLGGEDANPLIVEAVDVAGRYRAAPVLTREDGIRVAVANTESDFLGQCSVIFVVGPKRPGSDPALSDSTLPEAATLDSHDLDPALLDWLDPEGDRLEIPGQIEPEH